MLESQEQSNFHKLRIPKTDEWNIPKLQTIRYVKTKHTRKSVPSYRDVLDPVAI